MDRLAKSRFFGKVVLEFQGGRVTRAVVEKSIKDPRELAHGGDRT